VARFYIENFGCRATQADGAALERQFLERGMERAGAARDAEIVVLNTCTVTEGADKDARASIRRLQRVNPDCRILVTGCYAQRAPEELAALPGVTWVVGNSHKHQAAEIATSSSSSSGSVGFVSLAELCRSEFHSRKERERVEHPGAFAKSAKERGTWPTSRGSSRKCDCGGHLCAHRTVGGSGI
jgi:threonylcarbamoyladenosine tRNA methylthiotransferase MtaB